MMRLRLVFPVLGLSALMLAGCGAATTAPPVSAGTRPPVGFSLPPAASRGGDGILGRSADAVGTLFGPARLDVREGPGRKMQFAGAACILDVYFYAPKAGAAPVATHVDARGSDGRDADANGCIAALRGR